MTVKNSARERLAAGELAIGVGVRLARTIEIGKLMRGCGYDWLLIDLEHGTIGLDTASQISMAALDAGIAPIVRVPQDEYSMAARAIDGGAMGIIMPHVDTAEQIVGRSFSRHVREFHRLEAVHPDRERWRIFPGGFLLPPRAHRETPG